MNRLRRWVFNRVTALACLVTFVVTLMLVVQGLCWPGEILYDRVLSGPGFKRIMARSEMGQLDLWVSFDSQANAVGMNGLVIRRVPRGGPVQFGGFLGLHVSMNVQEFYPFPAAPGQTKWVRRTRFISVPAWMILVVTAPLSAWWMVNARRQRRRKRIGLCAYCGYDLRATPQRCPECGAIAMKAK